MIRLQYSVRRDVPASTTSQGAENCRIALVVFSHPGTGEPQTMCINEEMILTQAGPDSRRQQEVIEREVKAVLAEMTAGADFLPVLQ